MAAKRRSSGSRRARAAWAGVGVSALAVVVIALSFFALTQHGPVADAGSTPGATQPPADVAELPAESAAPAAVPAPAPQTVAVPNRVMAVIDADSAVRAGSTACPAPSTIETTDDAGATWSAAEAADVSTVQRITAGSDAFVALIGLAVEGCTPTYERSFTAGDAWQPAPEELAASWFVDPANRAGVHAPLGDRQAPCTVVVQVAVIDENSAAVLCDDASVHATVDAGATWLPPAAVPGAAAIGADGAGYRVAVLNHDGCVGAQVVGVEVGAEGLAAGASGACFPVAVAAGDVAVASADQVVWLWAGDGLARSGDGGATWL